MLQFFKNPRIYFSIAIFLFGSVIAIAAESSPVPLSSRQLLLVITPSDSSSSGQLYRFERSNSTSNWRIVSRAIPVRVGRNGLGWGTGQTSSVPKNFPLKKEGDGKSPAGIFELGTVFGFAPAEKMNGLKMPYLQITGGMECIDDVRSKYYNRIIDWQQVEKPDWQSSEKMRKIVPEYELGVIVNYNTDTPEAGKGSCIFLHIRGGPEEPTSGCTAMSTDVMKELAFWLDKEKHPVIVQLTKQLYQQLKNTWALPEIE